ncbi:ABC transporter ATP-binding protein [Tindallia californiensis]|uniref:NitT/TauT family transport system ATP-binding protein n=1 Tax=Tindallia californiensis TaxID=159292 RepID=A0A1H3Q2A7_9FIRM|nr:ABC transporter ATP-binding protein [Tindallia californiensis]SDZ07634.1 NitT/TauT family transport system ATP-binding protein [Tindallia californiensis]
MKNTLQNKMVFQVEGLHHSFFTKKGEETKVLEGIDFKVFENEFVAIVGPSGCGKSTILNLMSGLLRPTEGSVRLRNKEMDTIHSSIGYIAQSDTLLPWRTVRKNVEVGLEIRGIEKTTRKKRSMELIEKAELEGFEDAYPHELSGGMRKRVDIIKVLAVEPEIIFMDEPFASLDVFTREILQKYVLKVWSEDRRTIVFITHDLTEAITLADRIFILSQRPAKLKNTHCIDLERPRDPEELKFNPRFIELYEGIWKDLKSEVEMQVKEA